MATTTSLADLRARLSSYMDQVVRTHERVTITRNGIPEAVLISVDDLESMEETLDILRDPQALPEIEQARAEFAQGGGFSLDEVKADRAADGEKPAVFDLSGLPRKADWPSMGSGNLFVLFLENREQFDRWSQLLRDELAGTPRAKCLFTGLWFDALRESLRDRQSPESEARPSREDDVASPSPST